MLFKSHHLPFSPFLAADDGAANIGGLPPAADTPAPESAAQDPKPEPSADNPFGFNNPGAAADPNKGEDPKGDDPKQPEIPEEYEFKLADGLEINDQMKADFTAIAKECKLTQDQADKLIELHSKILLDLVEQGNQQKEQWMSETEKLGYANTAGQKNAKLALDTFGGSEATKALVETGVIFNPHVFKMMCCIGELLSEDNAPEGKPPTAPKTVGDIFFPNSK